MHRIIQEFFDFFSNIKNHFLIWYIHNSHLYNKLFNFFDIVFIIFDHNVHIHNVLQHYKVIIFLIYILNILERNILQKLTNINKMLLNSKQVYKLS